MITKTTFKFENQPPATNMVSQTPDLFTRYVLHIFSHFSIKDC